MAARPHRLPRGPRKPTQVPLHLRARRRAGSPWLALPAGAETEQRRSPAVTQLRSEEVEGRVQSHTVGLCTPWKLEL